MRSITALGLACAVVAGCVTSPVAQLTEGTYTLSVNAAFGSSSRSALEGKAFKEADEFCAKQGKLAHLINKNDTGAYGTLTSATIAFSCVTEHVKDEAPTAAVSGEQLPPK